MLSGMNADGEAESLLTEDGKLLVKVTNSSSPVGGSTEAKQDSEIAKMEQVRVALQTVNSWLLNINDFTNQTNQKLVNQTQPESVPRQKSSFWVEGVSESSLAVPGFSRYPMPHIGNTNGEGSTVWKYDGILAAGNTATTPTLYSPKKAGLIVFVPTTSALTGDLEMTLYGLLGTNIKVVLDTWTIPVASTPNVVGGVITPAQVRFYHPDADTVTFGGKKLVVPGSVQLTMKNKGASTQAVEVHALWYSMS